MFEVDEAARIISSAADPDANVIFGAVVKSDFTDQVRITVIATGFDETQARIAKMSRPIEPVRIEGLLSNQKVAEEEKEEPVRREVEVNKEQVPTSPQTREDSSKDEFGEDFEIPAFLRKVH